MKKKITILGSTGSIGENALKIIQENTDKFEIVALRSPCLQLFNNSY